MTFGISGTHRQKVLCSISFESSHQWYLYFKWAKGWQSLYKDHALEENLILVHKTRYGLILILASVVLYLWFLAKINSKLLNPFDSVVNWLSTSVQNLDKVWFWSNGSIIFFISTKEVLCPIHFVRWEMILSIHFK